MFEATPHPHLVPFDGKLDVAALPTAPPPDAPAAEVCAERLTEAIGRLKALQRLLYAGEQWSVLLVFQALDGAGKDSVIRSVMTGVNPAGCVVRSFRPPSEEELAHDFLWRSVRSLPRRGRIGVFNRSYYEEVLVVRVHPEHLKAQHLPAPTDASRFWRERFESIRDHEKHLARNGTVVLKFWLNVSREEQRRRFLDRIDQPDKNWKFSAHDIEERRYWDDYMVAYQEALAATSRPWAPWYAVPANVGAYARMTVAEILVSGLEGLRLRFPRATTITRARLLDVREQLEQDE